MLNSMGPNPLVQCRAPFLRSLALKEKSVEKNHKEKVNINEAEILCLQ